MPLWVEIPKKTILLLFDNRYKFAPQFSMRAKKKKGAPNFFSTRIWSFPFCIVLDTYPHAFRFGFIR